MADHKYQQVAESVRLQIESGEIRPGAHLPTELELREKHNASRNTVRDALKLLIDQGHVETRKGRGWFAARREAPLRITMPVDQKDGLVGTEGRAALEAIRAQGLSLSGSRPEVTIQAASPEIARLLQLAVGISVISRSQRWYVDTRPWSLQTTAYRRELAARAPDLLLDEDIRAGAVAYIDQQTGITEIGHEDLVTSRQPTAEEAAFFQMAEGAHAPVTVVSRTGYRAAGADLLPLRVTTTVYLADQVQFAVTSGITPQTRRSAGQPDPVSEFGWG